MKVLFRPYSFIQNTLHESMEHVKEFGSRAEFVEYLKGIYYEVADLEEKLEIFYQNYDNRIDWQTYMVKIKDYCVVGFLNGEFE